jgi:UDP-glucose:(heptosyl)LPS alpha-1,3-glucosyltransferase
MTAAPSPQTPPKLRIALAVFRLRPAGGREQQALALAAELAGRGHRVSIVTTTPAPDPPPNVAYAPVSRRGWTSHGRLAAFAADAARATRGQFDRTVNFHFVPGFDVIFCTDMPRPDAGWRAILPRYRTLAALESAAFSPKARSLVLALSSAQLAAIRARYDVSETRGLVLPPAVDPARRDPAATARTAALRGGDGPAWLWAGLQPTTKGLDRAITALAGVPGARLRVCGLGADDAKAAGAQRLARRLGVADRIDWLGFLTGPAMIRQIAEADLLIHPARADVTGNVILEAMINGLPGVVSGVCGFAEHVALAGAGVVLAEPFAQKDLDRAVAGAVPETLARWSAAALAYAAAADLYGGVSRAADLIEGCSR